MDAEVIIVGGGVNGLWAAYQLADQGVKSILFEQFTYPHTRGSSHGQSRITRSSYADENYSSMMPEAHRRWKELEKKSNKSLLIKTGLLSIYNMTCNKSEDDFYSQLNNLSQLDIHHYVVPGKSLEKSFPGLKFSSDFKAIYDSEAGILKADNCLAALRECFKVSGGIIHEGEPVVGIKPINRSLVRVKTSKKTYSCSSVVLACGAYVNELLATVEMKVPVKTCRIDVTYWKDTSDKGLYSASNYFPCAIMYPIATSPRRWYSIPSYEYPGLIKICNHAGPTCDPFRRDALTQEMEKDRLERLDALKKDIAKCFTDVDAKAPTVTETCMYTVSPDSKYIIDYHPKYKNIVIATGFSGQGFKTSPSIGHILANMALGLQSPYPLEPFSLKRFSAESKL